MSVPAFEAGTLFTTLDIIMIDIGAPETSREKVCNAKKCRPNDSKYQAVCSKSAGESAPESALVSPAADPADDAADRDQRRRGDRLDAAIG